MSWENCNIRSLNLNPEQIKNIFYIKPIDFAYDDEKKKYNIFNIKVSRKKTCYKCDETFDADLDECPYCGGKIKKIKYSFLLIMNKKGIY